MSSGRSAQTILRLFAQRISAAPDRAAVWDWADQGQLQSRSWQQVAEDAFSLAAALSQLGVNKTDRVASVVRNRYEWIVIDLATALAFSEPFSPMVNTFSLS